MKKSSISGAFYNEAVENYAAAKILFENIKSHPCMPASSRNMPLQQRGSTFFMLLQMAVEKLAKAASCKMQGDKRMPSKEHDILPLMAIAMRNPKLNAFFERNRCAYDFIINELNPLQPSNSGQNEMNLEYPWVTKHNEIKYPAKDLALIKKYLNNPMQRNFLLIMEELDEFITSFSKIMRF